MEPDKFKNQLPATAHINEGTLEEQAEFNDSDVHELELSEIKRELHKAKLELNLSNEKCANLEKSLLHSQGVARQRIGEITKLNEKLIYQESECGKKQAKLSLWVSNMSASIEHGETKREMLKEEVNRLHEALDLQECENRRLAAKLKETERSAVRSIQVAKEGFERSLQTKNIELVNQRSQLSELEAKIKQLSEVVELKVKEINVLEMESDKFRIRLAAEIAKSDTLAQEISLLKQRISSDSHFIKGYERELSTCKEALLSHEAQHKSKGQEYLNIKCSNQKREEEIRDLCIQIEALQISLHSKHRDKLELQEAMIDQAADIHRYSVVIDSQQERIQSLEHSLEAIATSTAREISSFRIAYADVKKKNLEARWAEKAMTGHTAELEQAFEALQGEKFRLESELTAAWQCLSCVREERDAIEQLLSKHPGSDRRAQHTPHGGPAAGSASAEPAGDSEARGQRGLGRDALGLRGPRAELPPSTNHSDGRPGPRASRGGSAGGGSESGCGGERGSRGSGPGVTQDSDSVAHAAWHGDGDWDGPDDSDAGATMMREMREDLLLLQSA